MMTANICPYVYYPDCFGKADCVYFVDRNGTLKKKSLACVGVDSISFYTTRIVSSSPTTIVTDVFLCSADNTDVQQMTWNLTAKTFQGTIYVLIKVVYSSTGDCIYVFVETVLAGTLTIDSCGNYFIDVVYPVKITPNLDIKTIDSTTGQLIDFTPASLKKTIQCALQGSLKFNFPEGPLTSWLGLSRYFAVAYIQYPFNTLPCLTP